MLNATTAREIIDAQLADTVAAIRELINDALEADVPYDAMIEQLGKILAQVKDDYQDYLQALQDERTGRSHDV